MKLPDGWSLERLEKLVKFRSGGTPNKSRADFWRGEFPWVTAKDLKSLIIRESLDHLTNEGLGAAKIAPENSILILVRGMTLHKDVPVCLTSRPVAFNQDIKALVCSKTILPIFLVLYLRFQKSMLLDLVDSAGHGTGRIDTDLLKKFQIRFPTLQSQRAIADLLSTWDEAIEKTTRLIQAKEKNARGLMQRLISRQCSNWPHLKPSKMFDTITEKNFPDEQLLSVTQDRGVIPRSMLEGRVMSPDGTTADYKLIKQGDFAISLRSFQGGIEYSNYHGIISPAYTVLRPKIKIHSDFYRLFFKSYIFIEKYLSLSVIGIRDGKQISIPDFMGIKIPVPPIEEQIRIADSLSISQKEIELLRQLAEKYKTQKRGLMQKLLTGQWRVKPEIINRFKEQ